MVGCGAAGQRLCGRNASMYDRQFTQRGVAQRGRCSCGIPRVRRLVRDRDLTRSRYRLWAGRVSQSDGAVPERQRQPLVFPPLDDSRYSDSVTRPSCNRAN